MKNKKNVLVLILISIVSSIGLNSYELVAKQPVRVSKLSQDKNKNVIEQQIVDKQNEPFYKDSEKLGRLLNAAIACTYVVAAGYFLRTCLSGISSGSSKYVAHGLAEVVQPEDLTTTFDSIIGLDDVKKEIKRFMSYIEKPDDFMQMGLQPIPGVILHGVPGTGKTDLARAAAKQAGLPFLYLSGSALHSKWRGEGVERINALMKQIDEQGSCLVFIDEIDGLAGKTNDKSSSGLDDAQVLNAFKIALDGFKSRKKPVFFMGATNEIDKLDPAIVRPGRFRPILVPVPTKEEQELILHSKLYEKGIKADSDIDIKPMVAGFNANWTGAQIATIVNEAAWRAFEAGKKAVTRDSLQSAIDYFLQKEEVESQRSTNVISAY